MSPININVLPDQLSTASVHAALPTSHSPPAGSIVIPGLLDTGVEQYTSWQQSRVSNELLKEDIKKACHIALANGLDLKQIYEDRDPDFFVKHGVKIGVARRFVGDISDWVRQCDEAH